MDQRAATRFPDLHVLLTGAQPAAPVSPEIERLSLERADLIRRQIGMPKNREKLRELTHAQLAVEVGH